jgi:hypothetical protein
MPLESETIVVGATGDEPARRDYVDWPAIFAGILVASAIGVVMLTFGSAIGLSFANFHGGTNVSPIWIGIAAASWLLWVEVSSLLAGGYLTGRLRRRVHDATEHESDIRDGAHGLIVWAGTLLIGGVLALSGVGASLSAIGSVASTATTAAAAATATGAGAGTAAGKNGADPTAYFTDALFRPAAPNAGTASAAGAAPAAGTTAPGNGTAAPAAPAAAAPATGNTSPATPASAGNAGDRAAASAEAGRILANGAAIGSIPDDDKAYLAQLVSTNTGLSPDDAKKRVDTVLGDVEAAKQKAMDAAETARKTGVLAAFLIAASLLVAAAAAYWAAMLGGNHRDEQIVFENWTRR